jgi:peptidoglycan hydrolase-like protein with peptidoglycan-binding domain
MSKASGILLIAVGVGVAAYAMPSHNGPDGQQPTQELSVPKAAPNDAASIAAATTMTTQKALAEVVPPDPKPANKPAKDASPIERKNAATVPAKPTIVAAPRTYERLAPVDAKPAIIPGDRVSLTRDLQRELRRVGCYDGTIDGTWSPGSRRAMKAFTDRVNASLPIDQPDYILLRLLQSSPERVCGVACPVGQGLSGDGRCLPDAVLAQAARKTNDITHQATSSKAAAAKPAATTSAWSTTTTAVTRNMPAMPEEGRMSLAGPSNAAAAARRTGNEPSALAGVTQTPDATAGTDQAQNQAERAPAKNVAQRKSNLASVDSAGRRPEASGGKKFGTWFFRQQDIWRN